MQKHQIKEQDTVLSLRHKLNRTEALAERVSHENSYLVAENARLRAELHALRTKGEVD